MKNELTKYEKEAIVGIHEWKNPQIGWFGKAMEIINWPIERAGDLITEVPGVEWVIEHAIGGLVSFLNDIAHWSVRPDAIYEEYKAAGFDQIKRPKDIFSLDLEDVDKVNGYLAAKYKAIALAEGAATGSIGLPGIPPDIVALITLNQRAIGEYATYYGFDISSQQERLFALNILGLASSPNDAAKQVAMAQLVRIAQDVAKKKVWKDLEKHSFVTIIRLIARSLGIRLTKAKLAQIIPVTGAIVGRGFNVYYTNNVCDAAFYLYRERFLAEKYGEDIIEVTVEPADNFEPDYED
ncbi:EcsC family protein [bacterium]|nr:EcsC family protein [bacterium]